MSRPSRQALAWLFALGLLLALSLASLMVGAGDMHWSVLWSRSEDDLASQVLVYSRVPLSRWSEQYKEEYAAVSKGFV